METVKTEFNSSLAKLMRIDKLRQELHIATFEENLKQSFHCLVGIRKEIWEKLNDKERKSLEDLEQLKNEIDKYYYKSVNKKPLNLYNKLYWSLDIYSRKMSDLEFKDGLSIVDAQTDDEDDDEW